jgi:ketosteroid isomerase-like protein
VNVGRITAAEFEDRPHRRAHLLALHVSRVTGHTNGTESNKGRDNCVISAGAARGPLFRHGGDLIAGSVCVNVAAIAVLTAAEYNREMAQDSARDETQVWNLEKAYWEYVKANDLEKYRALWHNDFVAWPPLSSAPLRKDQVTDWLTENMSKGIKLQSFAIEQLAIQVIHDTAIVHYRIKMVWAGPGPTESNTEFLRVTHIWIRTHGAWQIIGGMGAPVNAEGK